MEQHKLEEANMTEQPEPIYSLNMHEGEYIRGIITYKINIFFDKVIDQTT